MYHIIRKGINTMVSALWRDPLPVRDNVFDIQRKLLSQLSILYKTSPLYQKLGIKQEEVAVMKPDQIKAYIAQFPLVEYKDHIYPLVESDCGITHTYYDLHIQTSGTSDAIGGGKLIPARRSSFAIEQSAIQRTIAYYLQSHTESNLLFGRSFSLTAPFDIHAKKGYVSGAIQSYNKGLSSFFLYRPRIDVDSLSHIQKIDAIIEDMIDHKSLKITSFHGVPTWYIDIIRVLIERYPDRAKEILSDCEYISIGGGSPGSYKEDIKALLESRGCGSTFAGSNNHNASEGFLGSQVRNFTDLHYHWMAPCHQQNVFLFVPVDMFASYTNGTMNYETMIQQSHLLHEVVPGQEYLMMIANDRIPWFYNIKDKVVFRHDTHDDFLEYIVVGRYGMSSNIMNEHIETNHIQEALGYAITQGYDCSTQMFVGGMQIKDNTGIFHIIVESDAPIDTIAFGHCIDQYWQEHHDQWKRFRHANKIHSIDIQVIPFGRLLVGLQQIGVMKDHSQAKIPHLSDNHFEQVVQPLLAYIKNRL